MSDNRPVNLDLTKFSFPLPAITSIIHRVTGVALFVGIVFMMYVFELSLDSAASFEEAKSLLDGAFAKLILWGILSFLLYHLVAGIKHLLMDMGIGETLEGGQQGATATLVISGVLIVLAGIWVW